MIQQPDILWHYTTWAAMEKIIAGTSIWASHMGSLNDSDEMTVGLSRIRAEIEGFEKLPTEAKNRGIKALDEMLEQPFFVTSFCDSYDLLSQWRAYSDGINGVALGFSFDELKKFEDLPASKALHKCVYREEEYRGVIKGCAGHWIARGPRRIGDGGTPEDWLEERAKYFIQHMSSRILMLKNSKFEEEKEWRLVVQIPDSSLHEFHQTKSRIVPHVTIKLEKEGVVFPLRKVLVGPNPHMKLTVRATKMLLRKHAVMAEVSESTIPYRNW